MNDTNTSRFTILKSRTVGRFKNRRQERKEKQRNTLGVIFFAVLLFFGLSLLAYKFQYLIPHMSVSSGSLISPNSNTSQITDFKNELIKQGIQFESIKYATQSPTLIVKLPKNAYAYLNTSAGAASQAKLLSTILSRLSIQEKDKKLKYVDLRFERAIIKF